MYLSILIVCIQFKQLYIICYLDKLNFKPKEGSKWVFLFTLNIDENYF